MKKLLITFAVLLVMGALAVAQTGPSEQAQDKATTNLAVVSGIDLATGSSPNTPADLNSADMVPPDFRGTELEKAYQQEEQDGWKDPNIIYSTGLEAVGGQ